MKSIWKKTWILGRRCDTILNNIRKKGKETCEINLITGNFLKGNPLESAELRQTVSCADKRKICAGNTGGNAAAAGVNGFHNTRGKGNRRDIQ